MAQSIILTGLDLVRSKQEADPGSLSACENFEIGNIRGLTKIQGIKGYSGLGNDVINPYIIHSVSGQFGRNIEDFGTNFGQFNKRTKIQWGSGGNYDAKTRKLTTVDGSAYLCYDRMTTRYVGVIAFFAVVGRLPSIGDVIVGGPLFAAVSGSLTGVPVLLSDVIGGGAYSIFGLPTDSVDEVSDLINQMDVVGSPTSGHSYATPVNPMGHIAGGFYFKDSLYFIADVEKWTFTSGSEEPSVDDQFRLYYAGIPATSLDFTSYFVESFSVESGDWATGDAAGTIMLRLNPGTKAHSSPVAPTACKNQSTSNLDPMTMGSLVRSSVASLYKAVSGTPGSLFQLQDLGHEVSFASGDNYFTVINRANRESNLETAVTTTDWTQYTAATGWTNSNNAIDGVAGTYATQANLPAINTGYLTVSGPSLAIPADAVILGVEVEISRRKLASGNISARDRIVTLAGVPGSPQNKKKAELWPVVNTAVVYGSATDLWGTTLTPDIVNDPAFGLSIAVDPVNGSGGTVREIDSIRVRVTYKRRSSTIYFGDQAAKAITSITSASSTATVTTTLAHGYADGDTVTITGAVQPEYNGDFVITVTGLSTFTYTVTGTPAPLATGTITAFRNFGSAQVVWYYKEKGDWSTSDAQGVLTLYGITDPDAVRAGQYMRNAPGPSGTLLAITSSGADKVYLPSSDALATNASQWVFTPEVNFYGATGTEQVFSASGADFGNSWDGTWWIRIRTGTDGNQDMPRHVAKFGDQLVFGYEQGVCIASDLGYGESFAGVVGGTLGGSSPISDDTITYLFAGGAQQILLGDAVNGLLNLADQNLAVGCKRSIQMLVGSGGSLVVKRISGSSGIVEYTLTDIGVPVFIDYRGIGTLSATDVFGDFARGRLSDMVAPWLVPRLQENGASFISNTGVIKTEVIKNKNQLRVYFRDKYVLTMTMVGNDFSNPQFTIQKLPFVPAMTCTGVTAGGKDLLFMAPCGMAEYGASSNDLRAAYLADPLIVPGTNLYAPAFVYQGDVGQTWDDKLPINAFVEINGGAAGREWEVKHYDKMLVHGQCYGFAPFGARFAVNFEPTGSGTPQNVNGGKTANPGYLAFVQRPFSVVEKVRTAAGSDGYALTIQFVSSGASVYGATSGQTSPYQFRPFTIQSIILLSESLKTRPPYAGT